MPELDEAAIAAVEQWRYEPTLVGRRSRAGRHDDDDELLPAGGRSSPPSPAAARGRAGATRGEPWLRGACLESAFVARLDWTAQTQSTVDGSLRLVGGVELGREDGGWLLSADEILLDPATSPQRALIAQPETAVARRPMSIAQPWFAIGWLFTWGAGATVAVLSVLRALWLRIDDPSAFVALGAEMFGSLGPPVVLGPLSASAAVLLWRRHWLGRAVAIVASGGIAFGTLHSLYLLLSAGKFLSLVHGLFLGCTLVALWQVRRPPDLGTSRIHWPAPQARPCGRLPRWR